MVWRRRGFSAACGKVDLILALELPLYPYATKLLITQDDIIAKGGAIIYGGDGLMAQFVHLP